ncbi:hypothetical protein [Fibrisoma limi]|nr:hypothetical protein [Fibrisoma limi]
MSKESFSYRSFIKNIYIELPRGYVFKHHSLEDDDKEDFLGRQNIKRDFLNVLMYGQKRGAYLVTGYRGMGKTSFVSQVIEAYKKEKNKQNKNKTSSISTNTEKQDTDNNYPVKDINISLAQTQVREVDILKYIVNKLVEDLKTYPQYNTIKRISINNIFSWGWPIITILLLTSNYLFINYFVDKENKPDSYNTLIENIIGLVSIAGLSCLLLYTFVNWSYTNNYNIFLFRIFRNSKTREFKVILEELLNLQLRSNAQVTSEDSLRETFTASVTALFKKDTKVYAMAGPREIEASLISILENLKIFKEYIFIFDELDKIEPVPNQYSFEFSEKNDNYLNQKTYLDDLRERRLLITSILLSLKFFINEAHARFVFIAGREMFEASLADISDRQSSISSVFHRVIYVDSFLKDNSERNNSSLGIGTLVETFINNTLFANIFNHSFKEFEKVSKREYDLLSKYYIYLLYIKKYKIASIDEYLTSAENDKKRITKLIENKKKSKSKLKNLRKNFLVFIKEYFQKKK